MSDAVVASSSAQPSVQPSVQVAAPPAIRLRGLRKTFGTVVALDGVDLDIADGEFFSLLGPSGSGKTTCLRLIAGFDRPTSGTVELHGDDVSGRPPFDREVNTVFQDYALFPHMSVRDNVAYGLKVKKVPKPEIAERVAAALDMVRLAGFETRKPGQLSGGQRQRVALARALVNRPRVLLLDEPLGALDLKLRHEMQAELKRIQREVGITFVYVTHDQEEALTMSDRLALFNQGRIEQLGAPAAVYEEPATLFAAGFLGTSNLIEGDLARRLTGSPSPHTVRPERIRLGPAGVAPPDGHVVLDGTVADVVFLGSLTRYWVEVEPGVQLTAVVQNADGAPDPALGVPGHRVLLTFSPTALRPMASDGMTTSPEPGGTR